MITTLATAQTQKKTLVWVTSVLVVLEIGNIWVGGDAQEAAKNPVK
jgi:hypothetical protein